MAKRKKDNLQEVQNAVKTLFANIRFSSVDDPVRSIVLTSAVPNEGKTTISLELGRAIASTGASVLLVEADMRRRHISSMLGIHTRQGVYAVLSGQTSVTAASVPTRVPNLYFLDVEPEIPNPADLLASRAYARMVTEAEDAFDYVIFDMPPVGTFVDAAILGSIVDGLVMVCRVGSTKRAQVVSAVDQLRKADCNILGVCATFCENTSSEYYYSYYSKDRKDGKGKDKGKKSGKGSHSVEAALEPASVATSAVDLPDMPMRQRVEETGKGHRVAPSRDTADAIRQRSDAFAFPEE